jgi:hypothetical protein
MYDQDEHIALTWIVICYGCSDDWDLLPGTNGVMLTWRSVLFMTITPFFTQHVSAFLQSNISFIVLDSTLSYLDA